MTSFMHRTVLELAGIDPGVVTDHINGDGLDNRLKNLRPATNSQNCQNSRMQSNNTSGFKGVTFNKRGRGAWQVQIRIDGARKYIGRFATAEEAGAAYERAAMELHGDFARLR
mgnify:CR=1 FL=1